MIGEVLLFILICYGMTTIIVWGKIFNYIRPKYALFHCCHCMGFWVGAFVATFAEHAGFFRQLSPDLFGVFLLACLSSGTSYALNKVF